ncbi:MAG TPA: MarR family transcriptional regulator [Acidimicrobiales bacterium]|jgi:MarR family transcriptional regulator for hemolysin
MGPPDVEPIGLQLTRTAKLVGRAFDAALGEVGGSVPMWLILVSLKARHHGAQRDVAEAVGIEGPTLTHHLNRMEKAGLVTRTRDPENRRVHRVELTEAGEAAFRHQLSAVADFDRQLRANFTAKELDALGQALLRLRTNATGGDTAA